MARKTAKKRNKRAARDGAKDDKGVARDRKKKVTPKRRAGVCYGQPVVTLEDKRVTDDEDSDGNAGEEHYDVLAGANLNRAHCNAHVHVLVASARDLLPPFSCWPGAAPSASSMPKQRCLLATLAQAPSLVPDNVAQGY